MVDDHSIHKFIKSINEIYSIPSVALKVVQQISDPEVRISDLSRVIQVDQALTANILKVVNSGYFNFQDEIVTIKKAIVLMGLKLTKEITISFAVKSLMKGMTEISNVDYKTIWMHSAYSAFFAKKLGDFFSQDGDTLYISGLLHDLGLIVEILYDPEMVNQIFEEVNSSRQPFYIVEKKYWKNDHALVGDELLKTWNISPVIRIPLKYHHQLENISPDDKNELEKIRIIHFANIIAHIYENNSEFYRGLITEDKLENLGIDEEKFWDMYDQFCDELKAEAEYISLLL